MWCCAHMVNMCRLLWWYLFDPSRYYKCHINVWGKSAADLFIMSLFFCALTKKTQQVSCRTFLRTAQPNSDRVGWLGKDRVLASHVCRTGCHSSLAEDGQRCKGCRWIRLGQHWQVTRNLDAEEESCRDDRTGVSLVTLLMQYLWLYLPTLGQ